MPAWIFGVVSQSHHDAKRWQDRLCEPPKLPGKEEGRPVVSFRRIRASEKAKKTGGVLDMEEQLLLREVFDSYDRDQSQELDKAQMRDLMAGLNDGMFPTDYEVDQTMKECDASKSGGIDFEEFVKAITWWYQNTHPDDYIFNGATVHDRRMEAARQAKKFVESSGGELQGEEARLAEQVFSKYDQDKAGQINSGELTKMMTDMNSGIPPTEQEVAFLMWSNDFGQTGTLSLNEFKQAVLQWYSQTHTGPAAATDALRQARESQVSVEVRKNDKPQEKKSGCCLVS
eukprot:Hpha_TRINITY_DN19267_c0_g1::TRINITY_DN19267_c0_g1_i1::g.194314::m.194314